MATSGEIYEKIKEYPTTILHRHTSPDPDAISSQTGLVRLLRLAFPDRKILRTGGDDEDDLIRINKMDEITPGDYQGALVIATDTVNTPYISNKNHDKGDLLTKTDHHSDVDPHADMSYVDPDTPAASEIVFDFSKAGSLPVTEEAAAALYTGIVDDTDKFMYPEVSARAFGVAAELTKVGINITNITKETADVIPDEAKLQALAMDKMGINPAGAAYTILMQDNLKKVGSIDNQANVVVLTSGRIKDVLAWNMSVEKPDGTFHVHYRSKGPVINHLVERRDGSGHILAPGANAEDVGEVKQVFSEVVEVAKKYDEEHGASG